MPAKPSPIRRIASGAATFIGTCAVAALAVGMVMVGSDTIAARAERAPVAAEIPPIPVAVVPFELAERYPVRTEYSGRVEARRRVDLGFEAGGTVAEILAEEGDHLSKGDVVARLDTRALDASRMAEMATRDALLAEVELAELTADRRKALVATNAVTPQSYDEARLAVARLTAQVAAAEARIAGIDVALSKAVITAPFDATVGTRTLDEGATAGAGQAILSLIEVGAPEFRAGLPADLAVTLSRGDEVQAVLNGAPVTARVDSLRDDIDPVTRTMTVTFALDGAANYPDGTLGRVTLERSAEARGTWVPAAALSEGLRGLWTIYVAEEGMARREAVELLHTEGDRAYVRGALPDAGLVVAGGPHRLTDGQPITLER